MEIGDSCNLCSRHISRFSTVVPLLKTLSWNSTSFGRLQFACTDPFQYVRTSL